MEVLKKLQDLDKPLSREQRNFLANVIIGPWKGSKSQFKKPPSKEILLLVELLLDEGWDGRASTLIEMVKDAVAGSPVNFTGKVAGLFNSSDLDGTTTPGGGGSKAWNYVGIPYVTDPVPTAIMPALPNGATTVVWPYDPCTVTTPVWEDAANQYYVNPAHPSANDLNNGGRGSPTLPRLSIPGLNFAGSGSWSLAAGSQVFIVGDGNTFGSQSDIQSFSFPGTSSDPIWIIGVSTTSKPLLNLARYSMQDATYVMWHNIHFGSTNNYRSEFAGVENNCWRQCLFTGGGTVSTSSRRLLNFIGNPSQINKANVIYQCEGRDLGSWNPGTQATDCLGVHVQAWNRHTWIIDSNFYHIQGDSVMTGNSNYWDFDHARRSHYTYIAGNEFFENYENAYDCKDSYHTIFSSNHCHDFSTTGSEPTANSTCIIMGQDSEGFLSGYTWIINNLIENSGTGARCSATSDTYRGFVLNNLLINCSTGLVFEPRSYTYQQTTTTEAEYVCGVNNTFIDCGQAFSTLRGSSGVEVEFEQNLIVDCTGTYDVWFEDFQGNPRTYANNIVYRSGGGENVRLDGSLTTSNNTVGVDPNLDVNYVPQSGSIAIDYVTGGEHAAYAEFQALYGLDIRQDYLGNTRPQGTYDCGAIEVV